LGDLKNNETSINEELMIGKVIGGRSTASEKCKKRKKGGKKSTAL
jgi:hypothetical protein